MTIGDSWRGAWGPLGGMLDRLRGGVAHELRLDPLDSADAHAMGLPRRDVFAEFERAMIQGRVNAGMVRAPSTRAYGSGGGDVAVLRPVVPTDSPGEEQ